MSDNRMAVKLYINLNRKGEKGKGQKEENTKNKNRKRSKWRGK